MGNTQQKPAKKPSNPLPPPKQQQEQAQKSVEVDSSSSALTCEICIEPVTVSQSAMKFNNKNCIHSFCTDCLIKHIQVKLEDNWANIHCPAPKCYQNLDPLSCRPFIPSKLFDKWCDMLCNSTVLGMNGVYCPNRDCSELVVNECGGDVEQTICPSCKKEFCFWCRIPWHAGLRCEDSVEMKDENDAAFGALVEAKRWMRCPRCRHFVENAQGCEIVRCRCGVFFCYKCGNNLRSCNCRRTSEEDCMFFSQLGMIILLVFSFTLLLLTVAECLN